MRYIISGRNIDVTEGLKSAIYEKLGKLERYFTPETEVHVTFSVEKERQKIEVTIILQYICQAFLPHFFHYLQIITKHKTYFRIRYLCVISSAAEILMLPRG